MSTAFTPGPWSLEDPFDFELSVVANGDKAPGDWTFVAGCKLPDEDDHDITGREAYANARLIAAAPDLYEALHSFAAAVATTAMQEAACERLLPFAMKAQAVLKKARGDQ